MPVLSNGGLIYHIVNRSDARMTLFEKDENYAAFHRVFEHGTRLVFCYPIPKARP